MPRGGLGSGQEGHVRVNIMGKKGTRWMDKTREEKREGRGRLGGLWFRIRKVEVERKGINVLLPLHPR